MRDRLPMHVINGVTVALGVGLIQALLHAAAGPHASALAMTGAICASLADLPLRPERNWRRVAAGALMGLGAAALMLLTEPHAAARGVAVAFITFVAMMMLGWGPRAGPASFAAVLSVVFTMGLPAAQPVGQALLWQAAGAGCYLLWSVATSLVLQPVYRRLALTATLDASARLLRARVALLHGDPGPGHDALREWVRSEAQLADRLQLARDLLFAARPTARLQRRIAVLLRLIDLRDLLLASALDIDRVGDDAAGRRLRDRYTDRLERLAQALVETRSTSRRGGASMPALDEPALPPAHDFDAADPRRLLLTVMERRLQRLAGEVRSIGALMHGGAEVARLGRDVLLQFVAPEGWPLRALKPHVSGASPVLRHAVRAGIALAAAYYIALVLPWASHPQWLVLSVAVILRSTFEQTVMRRNLRVAGTVLGCLVVLGLSRVSAPLALSAAFLVAIGLAHGFAVERYLVTAMAGTMMALLQAHLVAPDEGFPIAERLADTVLGAALAWGFSYLLPSWERRLLPGSIGRVLAGLRDYAQRVLSPDAAPIEQRQSRRRAYDLLGALSASVQRSVVEPAGVRPALEPLVRLLDQAQRLMALLLMVRLLVARSAGEGDAGAVTRAVGACADKYAYGSYGNGTSSHIHGEMFNEQAGLKLQHVPYKGAAPMLNDLLGGQLKTAFLDIATGRPHLASGKFKVLATTGAQRLKATPDVPTFTELGYKDFEPFGWFGVFVPAATPKPIVDKLAAEVVKIVQMPDVRQRLEGLSLMPVGSTPAEFAAAMRADSPKWLKAIKDANITLD